MQHSSESVRGVALDGVLRSGVATIGRGHVPPFNPDDETIQGDPYGAYARYREFDPVHSPAGRQGSAGHPRGARPTTWFLFDYADVVLARKSKKLSRRLRHRRLSARPIDTKMKAYSEMLASWMVEMDDPDHSRIRAMVARSFAAYPVRRLRPRIEEIAARLLSDIRISGPVDLISAFAFPLPLLVMLEIVGLPADCYRPVLAWSRSFSEVENRRPTIDRYAAASQAAAEFRGYLRPLVGSGDFAPRSGSLLDHLMRERREHRLTEDELLGTVMFLLFAGHETTANLIGNAIYTLLSHPDQLAWLRKFPQHIGPAVEEVIRYECPVQSVSVGHVAADLALRGRLMRPGDRLVTVIGSANRDEQVWRNPHVFDAGRIGAPHLGFGTGLHSCLGARLARVEAEIAIQSVLLNFADLALADGASTWRPGLLTRGLERLMVKTA